MVHEPYAPHVNINSTNSIYFPHSIYYFTLHLVCHTLTPSSVHSPATPHILATLHAPAVPDISTVADKTRHSFVVPEIIEHQDIADELSAIVTGNELPELKYSVVQGAMCQQKSCLVSSFNHIFSKTKTLKSGDTV